MKRPHLGNPQDHPAVERLKAYHEGQITEAEEDLIQEHFISCSECRETFLELCDFLEGVSRQPRWDPADLVREWRKVQTALHGESTSSEAGAEEAFAIKHG